MKSVETFKNTTPSKKIIRSLKEYGAVIVEDVFSHDTLDTVMQDFRPHFDREGRETEDFFNGYSTLRISNILEYSRASADIIGHSAP